MSDVTEDENKSQIKSKEDAALDNALSGLKFIAEQYVKSNRSEGTTQAKAKAVKGKIDSLIAEFSYDDDCPDGYHKDISTNRCVPD